MPVRSALLPALATLTVLACRAGNTPPDPAVQPVQPAGKAVSLAILEDYDKEHDLAAVARDFGLFRELGITTWRGSSASVTLPVGASRAVRYDLHGMSRPLPLAAGGRSGTLRIAAEDVAIIELFR